MDLLQCQSLSRLGVSPSPLTSVLEQKRDVVDILATDRQDAESAASMHGMLSAQ